MAPQLATVDVALNAFMGTQCSALPPDASKKVCNKNKYVPKTRTREALHSCSEFRADDKIKQCAFNT